MAFGDNTRKIKDKVSSGSGGDGSEKQYDSPFMPIGSGTRIFRPLQEVKDGQLVLADRVTANGKPVYKDGKRSGVVLQGPIPAEEKVFMAAWWDVNVENEKVPRRIMLDPFAGGDINTSRFKNPLWEFIKDNFEKGTQQRNAIKLLFAMNVYDMTPVMRNSKGQLFYPSESGHWDLLAYGNKGKIILPKDKNTPLPEHYNMDIEDALENEHAVPLNQIRILEGSYGKPYKEGGKHLFAQLEALIGTVEDDKNVVRNLGEFDLRLTTTGTGINTNYAIRDIHRFNALPIEVNLAARYDIEKWVKPWSDDIVQRLIDGDDYKEIVEEFNLTLFPQLFDLTEDHVYTGDTEKLDPESVGLKADEDEGLFDD